MPAIRRIFFYQKIIVSDAVFTTAPSLHFPFTANKIMIATNKAIDFSFGPNSGETEIDGELNCSDGSIAFDGLQQNRIWLQAAEPTEVRIWAWRQDQ